MRSYVAVFGLSLLLSTAPAVLAQDAPAPAEGAAAPAAGAAAAGEAGEATIMDGVFTAEQAERGAAIIQGSCANCHGRRLDGASLDPDKPSSPPIAKARFLREWEGRSLSELFEYTRSTMPKNNPASLTDQQYIDAIANMLSVSEMPAGETELPPDSVALGEIMIVQKPQ